MNVMYLAYITFHFGMLYNNRYPSKYVMKLLDEQFKIKIQYTTVEPPVRV